MKRLLILSLLLTGCGKDVDKDIPSTPLPVNHVIINKPLVPGGNVSDKFVITNDSLKVVYIADEDTDGINELYSADVIGTNRKRISAPLNVGENVTSFKVSPNSSKVAYIADETLGRFNLYTVDLDGSNHAQVNIGVPSNSHSVGHFMWTPSSSKIVYTSDENSSVGNHGLFIANPDGSGRITLNAGPVVAIFDIAGDGSRIVYRQGLINPNLRSIPPSGVGDVLLNTAFNLGLQPASGISGFVISSDSLKVLYRSNQDNNNISELFTVNIDGSGSRVKVSGAMVAGGNVAVNAKEHYNFSSDNSKIIYIADQITNGVNELFTSNVDGTSNTKISGAMVTGGNVINFKSFGSTTLFLADKTLNGVNELFAVGNDGFNSYKINSPLVAGENVSQYVADGSNVAYLMDLDNSGVYSAYTNLFDGSNEIELSNVTSGTGCYDVTKDYSNQIVLKDGLVFVRAALTSTNQQLYVVPIEGGVFSLVSNDQISGSVILGDSSLGSSFLITPNGVRTVYRMALPDGINLVSSLVSP